MLHVRAPSVDDADAIAALLVRCAERDGQGAVDAATVRSWMTDPELDAAADMRVVEHGGGLVGYVDIAADSTGMRVFADVRIDPAVRAEGEAGRRLLEYVRTRAAERAAGVPRTDDGPRLRAYAMGQDPAWVALLQQHGFRPVRHFHDMLISLDAAPPPPVLPDGTHIRAAREDETRALHAAQNEAFSDHWDAHPKSFERWLHMLDGPDADPSLRLVAVEGDQIAGLALCMAQRGGSPGLAWIDVLGVRPAWRRRGIALALLQHAFGAFRERGADRAGLTVDAASSTGALELYRRAGMHVHAQATTYDRAL